MFVSVSALTARLPAVVSQFLLPKQQFDALHSICRALTLDTFGVFPLPTSALIKLTLALVRGDVALLIV